MRIIQGAAAYAVRIVLFSAAVGISVRPDAWGHGFVGRRFFPATLTFNDPYVLDDLSLSGRRVAGEGENGARRTLRSLDFDLGKRITKPLMFSVGSSFRRVAPTGADGATGFGNLRVGLKYLTLANPGSESLVSFGVSSEIGDTGRASVGADRFSSVVPKVYFGQGLGAFLNSLPYLRPFVVTGTVQDRVPLEGGRRNVMRWGISVQYNIEYLEDMVKYIGIDPPFKGLVPIVEFPMETCLSRCRGSGTTGTINPGLIWWDTYGQMGLEAIVPANHRSGSGTGVMLEMDLYLENIFPFTVGAPIF